MGRLTMNGMWKRTNDMDWSKGYSASYHISVVDRETWRDISRIELTGGTINRSMSDLRDSATLDCVNYADTGERLIRVWLDADQNGASSHIPLFTGLAVSPGRKINGNIVTSTLQCYSVLKPAQDILLPRGWYAPKDANGAEIVKRLLKCTKAPIYISDNSPLLKQALIAMDGESNLSMSDAILDAIGWRLCIFGDGSIHIGPYDENAITTFDSLHNDILEQSIDIEYDWYYCPNVFRAVMDNVSAVARDDSEDSIFSTVSRGREVWAEETNCALNDGESVASYANRRLKELQRVSTTVSYTRRFIPNIYVGDSIRLNYPAQNLLGKYIITSQSITLGFSAKTSEEVLLVV